MQEQKVPATKSNGRESQVQIDHGQGTIADTKRLLQVQSARYFLLLLEVEWEDNQQAQDKPT